MNITKVFIDNGSSFAERSTSTTTARSGKHFFNQEYTRSPGSAGSHQPANLNRRVVVRFYRSVAEVVKQIPSSPPPNTPGHL